MSDHLRTRSQYERAVRVVRELEAKIKDGGATDAEKERYQAGVDHLLIYEWAEQEVQHRRQRDRKAWWESKQEEAA
jgi:hypothetical protein